MEQKKWKGGIPNPLKHLSHHFGYNLGFHTKMWTTRGGKWCLTVGKRIRVMSRKFDGHWQFKLFDAKSPDKPIAKYLNYNEAVREISRYEMWLHKPKEGEHWKNICVY